MTTEMRYFRVGEGRTFHLPAGLVEGGGARVAAGDVHFRRWDPEKPKQRKVERGVHPHVVALEVGRINGDVTGEPFTRFVNKALLNGDLTEITEADYLQATGASSPPPARTPKSSVPPPTTSSAPASKESAS